MLYGIIYTLVFPKPQFQPAHKGKEIPVRIKIAVLSLLALCFSAGELKAAGGFGYLHASRQGGGGGTFTTSVTNGTYLVLEVMELPDGQMLVRMKKKGDDMETKLQKFSDFDSSPLPGDTFEPLIHDPDKSYRDGVEWLLVEEGLGYLEEKDRTLLLDKQIEEKTRELPGDEVLTFNGTDTKPELVCSDPLKFIVSIGGPVAVIPAIPFHPLLSPSE